ncbi:MAG: hypothetical protein OXF09_03555 [Hyphomicrobiales bacterium]|nr:hypothetical protein [Hyphomicrobiales bacterium]
MLTDIKNEKNVYVKTFLIVIVGLPFLNIFFEVTVSIGVFVAVWVYLILEIYTLLIKPVFKDKEFSVKEELQSLLEEIRNE